MKKIMALFGIACGLLLVEAIWLFVAGIDYGHTPIRKDLMPTTFIVMGVALICVIWEIFQHFRNNKETLG